MTVQNRALEGIITEELDGEEELFNFEYDSDSSDQE